MPSSQIPVLLDTDIGSDIDDAVALAYLLRQPRCELVGVTTVTGDVAKRAACVQVICEAAGRSEVPIHCGAADVLLLGPGQPQVPQYTAIAHRAHAKDWPANSAVSFMRQTIRRRPGEITLLTIGPLTNIALLFAIDPEIPSLLKGFVSMAGAFFKDGPAKDVKAEWNCLVDPIATAMVYRASANAAAKHLSVGLDVTLQCKMNAVQVRERFNAAPLHVVREMAEVWFSDPNRPLTFHDPLAAAVIFRPEICQYVDGKITIELGRNGGQWALRDGNSPMPSAQSPVREECEADRRGATLLQSPPLSAGRADSPHRVARSVNVDAFFEEYFSVFR